MNNNLEKYIIEVVKNKNNLMSEGLKFHINENIPITINIYRRGSSKYFQLFNEARELYNEGAIKLNHEIDEMYIISPKIDFTQVNFLAESRLQP